MLIGYARVSSLDQNLDLQIDALDKAGCDRLFTDTSSGAKDDRPGLHNALSHLRPGDTLVVWRLDRLGRNLKHLITTVSNLNYRDVYFRSLTENIDTTTSAGKLVFAIFGALAEFEREIIRERTLAGLAAARARGRKGGRRLKYSDKKIAAAMQLAAGSDDPITEVCESLGISRSTYYRRVSSLRSCSSN
ncbi:recombinase family protein [Gloeocapsopsis dulcis]|uniref:Resolvase n=1 Tax=Gloeocapsopsis dulcis AAB1 = 1H9 TaxID=1433147 RepID=A0A6N8G6L1_9CHRO|nr:recombinase family protein [Gloeocapsopsis dulcis]MUL39487.1 resolvase [Gloeocapsopsis dulcis AAB1 = 1H9]WNN89711.1 recombinase family protein [Gloeocapsopsis dulcis]